MFTGSRRPGVMILDLSLLFGIKSKIMTDDLVSEETGPANDFPGETLGTSEDRHLV